MIRYKTIAKEGIAEQIIDKSRFIAHVRPVESKADADLFFAEIRTLHKAATHNVPAYVIGEKFQNQWASDDGEPQGTSGAPMVQMLVKEGITNVAVIVTRYFGGIKLGTGGLVRAYTSSVKLAIDSVGICVVKEMSILEIKVDYTHHGKIQSLADQGEFQIRNTVFEDKVIIKIAVEPELVDPVKSLLSNVTLGKYILISESDDLVHIGLS